MNENLKVSTIITTYRRADMLKRAIDSVLNQTYSNIEVIVVDDNDEKSEDRKNTEEIMTSYANNPKVKYIKHKVNMNGAAARNTGIKNSTNSHAHVLEGLLRSKNTTAAANATLSKNTALNIETTMLQVFTV